MLVQDQREPTEPTVSAEYAVPVDRADLSTAAELAGATVERALVTWMRRLREQRGLSQTQVAERMKAEHGLNWIQTTVAKSEAGTRPLGFSEAAAWASVLGVSLDKILDPAADLIIGLNDAERELGEAMTAEKVAVERRAQAQERVVLLRAQLDAVMLERRHDPRDRT